MDKERNQGQDQGLGPHPQARRWKNGDYAQPRTPEGVVTHIRDRGSAASRGTSPHARHRRLVALAAPSAQGRRGLGGEILSKK